MRKKIKALATQLYESPETDAAFKRAWKFFPEWNDGGEDTGSAAEYILCDIQQRFPEGLSEKNHDALTEELQSMIYAGLT